MIYIPIVPILHHLPVAPTRSMIHPPVIENLLNPRYIIQSLIPVNNYGDTTVVQLLYRRYEFEIID